MADGILIGLMLYSQVNVQSFLSSLYPGIMQAAFISVSAKFENRLGFDRHLWVPLQQHT